MNPRGAKRRSTGTMRLTEALDCRAIASDIAEAPSFSRVEVCAGIVPERILKGGVWTECTFQRGRGADRA